MRSSGVLTFIAFCGCVPYVHSPSGRSFPLESAKALNPGETGLQLEGGGGFGENIAVGGVTARVRRGLVQGLDGNFEAGYRRIRVASEKYSLRNRNVYSARLGVKYAVTDDVALTAGLAGGGWTGGGFIGPDASLIVGYENPYCVPFFEFGAFASFPVRENLITLLDTGLSDDGDFVAAPTNTAGWTIGTGLRIPLSHKKDQNTKSALLLGARLRGAAFDNVPTGQRDHRTYFYGSGAFELVFGADRSGVH